MNRAEQWLLARGITRYFRDVRNKDVFKNRILPLIKDFAGRETTSILLDIRRIFVDWVGEINAFLKENAKKSPKGRRKNRV